MRALSADRLQLAVLRYDEKCRTVAASILSASPGISDSEFELRYWAAICPSFNAMILRVASRFDEATFVELHRLFARTSVRYLVDKNVRVLLHNTH